MILLMLIEIAAASGDLTGLWNITYKTEWGLQEVPPANNSSMTAISQKGSALQGDSSLGNRVDGALTGRTKGDVVDLAITFDQQPATVMQLSGSVDGDRLRGKFRAASSDGKSWRGSFDGMRASSDPMSSILGKAKAQKPKINPLDYMTANVNVVPTPTSYMDPEVIWGMQSNSTKKNIFAINYSKDTILMQGSRPFIWQWWL